MRARPRALGCGCGSVLQLTEKLQVVERILLNHARRGDRTHKYVIEMLSFASWPLLRPRWLLEGGRHFCDRGTSHVLVLLPGLWCFSLSTCHPRLPCGPGYLLLTTRCLSCPSIILCHSILSISFKALPTLTIEDLLLLICRGLEGKGGNGVSISWVQSFSLER